MVLVVSCAWSCVCGYWIMIWRDDDGRRLPSIDSDRCADRLSLAGWWLGLKFYVDVKVYVYMKTFTLPWSLKRVYVYAYVYAGTSTNSLHFKC